MSARSANRKYKRNTISTEENVMLDVMKSYANAKIEETKKDIAAKNKPGMVEDLSIGDVFNFGSTQH